MEQTYWTHSSYTNIPHHNLNKKKNPWCYFITCNLTTVFYLVPLLAHKTLVTPFCKRKIPTFGEAPSFLP